MTRRTLRVARVRWSAISTSPPRGRRLPFDVGAGWTMTRAEHVTTTGTRTP